MTTLLTIIQDSSDQGDTFWHMGVKQVDSGGGVRSISGDYSSGGVRPISAQAYSPSRVTVICQRGAASGR